MSDRVQPLLVTIRIKYKWFPKAPKSGGPSSACLSHRLPLTCCVSTTLVTPPFLKPTQLISSLGLLAVPPERHVAGCFLLFVTQYECHLLKRTSWLLYLQVASLSLTVTSVCFNSALACHQVIFPGCICLLSYDVQTLRQRPCLPRSLPYPRPAMVSGTWYVLNKYVLPLLNLKSTQQYN